MFFRISTSPDQQRRLRLWCITLPATGHGPCGSASAPLPASACFSAKKATGKNFRETHSADLCKLNLLSLQMRSLAFPAFQVSFVHRRPPVFLFPKGDLFSTTSRKTFFSFFLYGSLYGSVYIHNFFCNMYTFYKIFAKRKRIQWIDGKIDDK